MVRNSSSNSRAETSNNGERSIVVVEDALPVSIQAPLIMSYNDKIRPLLDVVDKLRHLKVTKEGIQLPTIVVVGDQSSGKSSVLESLAGISLPRGQGICTRVPLIMRLQNSSSVEAELYLEYQGKIVQTDEANISRAIDSATNEIAGSAKGISNTPITLHVKKSGVPDLTMVDLPGITRVPVHGQPEDIYEQISTIIMEYITPEESIILNVLSAQVDFPTCESIRMSQKVDKTGVRTLAVVTKADRAPEGLLEKVTADDVNIGLGYVCVRNRIGDESYDEARKEEANLFATHPLLSRIDKSIVGVPVLAQKLVQIQAASIAKCLPDIVKKINGKLSVSISELNKLPKNMSSIGEAMTAFMRILGSAKESLRKILIRGEFDEYPDEIKMHCTARLAEMLNEFSEQLNNYGNDGKLEFLMEEIGLLEEAKGITLPNFLPRHAFLALLQRKVKGISLIPIEFVNKLWNYLQSVVLAVIEVHAENYPQLLSGTRRAADTLLNKKKDEFLDRVLEYVEMERLSDYTCNPEYMLEWKRLLAQQDRFISEVFSNEDMPSVIDIYGFGKVKINHLRDYRDVAQQAFDMRMRISAYWKIVMRRMVDAMALLLLYSVHNLVNKELEAEIGNQLLSGPNGAMNIQQMLEETPFVAGKRERLNVSISLLKDAKDVVGKVIDRIAMFAEGTFKAVVKKKSTGEYKGTPYITTLLSTSLWTFYGILNPDGLLIVTVNGAGAVLQSVYVILFLIYAPKDKKGKMMKLVGTLNVGFVGLVIAVTLLAIHGASRLTSVGILCAALTIGMYAAPLAVMKTVIKTRSVEYMPFFLSFFLFLNAGVWSTYSLLVKDFYIGVPNAVGVILGAAQLILYFIYKNKSTKSTVDMEADGSAQLVKGRVEMQPFDDNDDKAISADNVSLRKGQSLPKVTLFRENSFTSIIKTISLSPYELQMNWDQKDDLEKGK